MATSIYYFTGTVKWAKVYPGQEDQKYGHYGINFYPDNLDEFKASGVQLQPKTDDDGTFYQLRRQPSKLIKGEVVKFGSPEVKDKDNNPFDRPIGNGSKVTVKVSVYDTMKGKGHRLDAVRVEEWVEYKKEDNGDGTSPNVPKLPF